MLEKYNHFIFYLENKQLIEHIYFNLINIKLNFLSRCEYRVKNKFMPFFTVSKRKQLSFNRCFYCTTK